MAAAVAMVTGTMVAPGPTSPVTGIIVSSLATRQFSKARGQGVVLMKQGGWSGTAGGRIIIRDTAPLRGLDRKESAKPGTDPTR